MKSTMKPLLSLFFVALLMIMCSPQKERDIMIDSIRLSNSTISLVKGEKITLEAEVLPLNSTHQQLSWYSTDNTIASVSNDGTIVANEAGEATITVRAGKVWTSCLVRVVAQKIPVQSFSSETQEVVLPPDEQVKLSYTVTPENTTDHIRWKSADESIARVVGGTVFARTLGTTTITGTIGDKSLTWTVHVRQAPPKVSHIEITPSVLEIEVDEVHLLGLKVSADRPEDVTITWHSSDDRIVSVLNGRITAKKQGSAVITAKSGELEGKCTVTVIEKSNEIKSLSLDKESAKLRVEESVTLQAHVVPESALSMLKWSSSDESIATVSPYGMIKAVGKGKAEITVEVGNRSAVCTLTVTAGLEADDFIIDISDISALDATVTLTPPDDEMTYVFDVYSLHQYETIEKNGGVIEHNFAFWKQFGDDSFQTDLKTGITKTNVADNKEPGPFPGMTYVATCFGIDRNKNVTSPLKAVKFELKGSTPSDNKITFKEIEITQKGIAGEITTTNADGYYLSVQRRRYVDSYRDQEKNDPTKLIEGLSPTHYMIYRALGADLKYGTLDELILHGNITLKDDYFGAKSPGREYVLIIVGMDKEKGLCTEPIYHYFKTKPRNE